MTATRQTLLSLMLTAPLAAFAAGGTNPAPGGSASPPYSPYADVDYPTDVYFGDTHVHTALSPT